MPNSLGGLPAPRAGFGGGYVSAPMSSSMSAMAGPAAFGGGGRFGGRPAAMKAPAVGSAMAEGIGFKTGGAQDVANFRENVKKGLLPIPTDVTYEGLVKDYFFDTSSPGAPQCKELFCPTYSLALSPDPLVAAAKGKDAPNDVFLAVGLDSGLTKFDRPRLNLAVVLDVSGSMDSPLDEYYYDRLRGGGARGRDPEGESRKTKLELAKEALQGVLDKLKPDDAVSITLFSDAAATPKKMGRWGAADAESVRAGVRGLSTVGSTNFQAGLDQATGLVRSYSKCFPGAPATTESRMVVLTDAQPNEGDISDEGLLARLKANAADGIHTTMIGIGLDFNTELVEKILKVKGANYFSVHTPGEFKQRVSEEFDSIVSPLVFDLELRVDPSSLAAASNDGASKTSSAGGGWRVAHVYGSPDTKEGEGQDGSIMKVLTLFPSPKTEEGVKGGVVLLRMTPPPGTTVATAPPLKLSAKYTDRSGKAFDTVRTVQVPADAKKGGPYFQSSGVRKAVALARLSDGLQSWLVEENAAAAAKAADAKPKYIWPDRPCDIILFDDTRKRPLPAFSSIWVPPIMPRPLPRLRVGCPLRAPALGKWERQSRKLGVTGKEQEEAVGKLLGYLKAERAAVKDDTLQQETDILQTLVDM
ncbi:MAG: hypothetical protein J3K34DRAFT_407955 [Monoraphidium minutum]|nr:MAG: hypothetical protein J3K34DRAFT_407955 [Monoraphidium minutum]